MARQAPIVAGLCEAGWHPIVAGLCEAGLHYSPASPTPATSLETGSICLRKCRRGIHRGMEAERQKRPMLRYLRIAVTVLSLTACVLLIMLWVRSYWRQDCVHLRLSNTVALGVVSLKGRIIFIADAQPVDRRPGLPRWGIESVQAIDWQLQWLGERIQRATFGFSLQRLSSGVFGFSLQLPHGLLVLLTGSMAATLGIRRPYRFSLRTLLIAMTLIAVILGIIAISN